MNKCCIITIVPYYALLLSDSTLTMQPTPPKLNAFSCQTSRCPLLPSEGLSNPLYTYFIRTSTNSKPNDCTASSICEVFTDRRTFNVKLSALS